MDFSKKGFYRMPRFIFSIFIPKYIHYGSLITLYGFRGGSKLSSGLSSLHFLHLRKTPPPPAFIWSSHSSQSTVTLIPSPQAPCLRPFDILVGASIIFFSGSSDCSSVLGISSHSNSIGMDFDLSSQGFLYSQL